MVDIPVNLIEIEANVHCDTNKYTLSGNRIPKSVIRKCFINIKN